MPLTSQDKFLGGKLIIQQPTEGFRSAMDIVLLAATVQATDSQSIMEVGCATGVGLFCISHRLNQMANLKFTGIDIQKDLIDLAKQNFIDNRPTLGNSHDFSFLIEDIALPSSVLKNTTVDHIITNPPFFENKKHSISPNRSRAQARSQNHVCIQDWIRFCLKRLAPSGTFTMIYPCEGLGDVLPVIEEKCGAITLFPLWSFEGQAAKRLIIKAILGRKTKLTLNPGLVIHHPDKSFTNEAQDVLVRGKSLML